MLRELADRFAPERTVTIRRQPIAVWYDDESRVLRRRSRVFEKRYRRSGLAEDRIVWVQHERERHRTNRIKEENYWQMCVSVNSGQPRKLWKVFSAMMGRTKAESAASGKPSAQSLLDYFIKKIDDIRQSTGSSPASTKLPPSPTMLHSFCLYSNDEVRKLIAASKTKSCALDPVPTSVLKEFLDELLPFITRMCNQSLLEGRLPLSQRHAIITPIVKKPGLDCEDVRNYRPISNLTYMSKFVERLVCKQVTCFLEENNLLPKHQSGFRARHSTETAVLKVLSDILAAADDGRVTLLGLLDMSAAFDTVDHHILLQRLEYSFGLTGTVLSWLASFLSGRTQQVIFNGMTSIVAALSSGVPQGSVLGPLLFLLYTADIPVIASEHGLGVHCYADDGQLYMSERPGNAGSVISKVTACIDEIDKWMSSNRLKLNSEKTQFIWLGSYQQIQKVTVESIDLAGSTLTFQSSVNDLGVLIDSQLTMREHVQRVCRSSFYQLRQLRVIRSSLSMKTCTALVHAFVTSRLDYCNSLLSGINKELLNRLESVLRSAARLVLRKRKFDPISDDIRNTLHWLPVRQRIEFKLGILVFKCLHGDAPSYLVESLSLVSVNPALQTHRSASRGDLVVPRTRTVRMGPRSFCVSGPKLWNSLPLEIRTHEQTLAAFKAKLKSHLFTNAYPN